MASRLLLPGEREPSPALMLDPSSAQFQLWLAQAQRDAGRISGRELAGIERAAAPLAHRSRTIFNPFTGEIRKVEI